MPLSASPPAHLKWNPERGFELNLAAEQGEVLLRLSSVPVPADGLVRLQQEPVQLHRLEILFKAAVDVGGSPGQLQEASVQLAGMNKLIFSAIVENAESGATQPLELEIAVTVAAGAPDAGGPVMTTPDEEALDWDDDETLESLFGDELPLPGQSWDPKPDKDEEPAPSVGMEALLNALRSLGDHPEPAPEPEPLALVEVAEEEIEEEPVVPSPTTVSDPGNARGLLTLLIDRELLALEPGFTVDALIAGAAPIVANERLSGIDKASRLSDWLLDQDAVEELYADDESLGNLLDQW